MSSAAQKLIGGLLIERIRLIVWMSTSVSAHGMYQYANQ